MGQLFSEPPALNEVEVSIFGPGYGEAVAVHLGNGKWLLVDSCIDPESGLPAALRYLMQLGVDVAQDVKVIVATHWHDDHLRGMAGLFNACQSAQLVISSVLHSTEFRKLIALYGERSMDRSVGVDEFVRIIELLRSRQSKRGRGAGVRLASADKLLWRDEIVAHQGTNSINVYALSPSDAAVLLAQLALADQSPQEKGTKRRLVAPSPNHASVALWIEIGDIRLLLGADLERTGEPSTGWAAVVTESKSVTERASVFKVPHHGSQNGHHDDVWTKLLLPAPFALLTPFRHGRHLLPKPTDIHRIASLTPNAYVTAPVRARPDHWRRRVVRDFVQAATKSIEPVYAGWGQVQLRRVIEDAGAAWRLQLFGDACGLQASDSSE